MNQVIVSRKTFLNSPNSFDDLPAAFPRNQGPTPIGHRQVVNGESSQQRLNATHSSIYKKITKDQRTRVAEPFNSEVVKLKDLDQRVRNDSPTKSAAKKLAKTRIPEKLIICKILASSIKTRAEKLKVLSDAKEASKKHARAIRKLTLKEMNDSTNFVTADLSFLVTTKNNAGQPKKSLIVSLPLKTNNPTYNYENLSGGGAHFKKFFSDYHELSKTVLANKGLKFLGQNSTFKVEDCDLSQYPQLAFHSEKFLFYYLIEGGGIAQLIGQLRDRGVLPQNTNSFDGMILRMHSTKEMCGSCEALSIGVKAKIVEEANRLLIQAGYTGTQTNTDLAIDISAGQISTRNLRNLNRRNHVNMRQCNVSQLPADRKGPYINAISQAQNYTLFTSAGQNKADAAKKERAIHKKAIKAVQEKDQKSWEKKIKTAKNTLLGFYKIIQAKKLLRQPNNNQN